MFSNNIIFIEKRKGDRNSSVVLHDNARKLLNWSSTIDVNEWINTLKNA
jgi:UDP-glucose 4-epimerase